MHEPTAQHGFIPPYILDRIIDHGSQGQRERALGTLTHVRSLLPNPGPPKRQPMVGVVPEGARPGEPRRSIHDAQQQMVLPGVLAQAPSERTPRMANSVRIDMEPRPVNGQVQEIVRIRLSSGAGPQTREPYHPASFRTTAQPPGGRLLPTCGGRG